jgi:uncharacterized protein YbjQ (UPF0145 family)
MANVIITTLGAIPGREIVEVGDVLTASNITPQFMANVGGTISSFSALMHRGNDGAYGSVLEVSHKQLFQDLVDQAEALGYDALVGLRISHVFSQSNDAFIAVGYATPCKTR